MSFYTVRQAQAAAERSGALTSNAAERLIKLSAAGSRDTYDIFLSHSYTDSKSILGVKTILEQDGKSVYVDWIEDPGLNRSRVTAATAQAVRARLQSCKSLIFVTSEASPTSKWMPWELGYFDGQFGAARIAVFPLVASRSSSFVGQEYLGLYPLIRELTVVATGRRRPFVTQTRTGKLECRTLESLLDGTEKYARVG